MDKNKGKGNTDKYLDLSEKQSNILLNSSEIINRLTFEIEKEKINQNNYVALIFDSKSIDNYINTKFDPTNKRIVYTEKASK